VLSDHEQRVLAELERCCAMEALEPDKPSRRVGRPGRSGCAAVLVLGAVSFALLIAGVAVAGLAVATATGIGWLFLRVWSQRADGGGIAASLSLGVGCGHNGPRRRPGQSIRQYLWWLSEAR
jgi:hypothetical protein